MIINETISEKYKRARAIDLAARYPKEFLRFIIHGLKKKGVKVTNISNLFSAPEGEVISKSGSHFTVDLSFEPPSKQQGKVFVLPWINLSVQFDNIVLDGKYVIDAYKNMNYVVNQIFNYITGKAEYIKGLEKLEKVLKNVSVSAKHDPREKSVTIELDGEIIDIFKSVFTIIKWLKMKAMYADEVFIQAKGPGKIATITAIKGHKEQETEKILSSYKPQLIQYLLGDLADFYVYIRG